MSIKHSHTGSQSHRFRRSGSVVCKLLLRNGLGVFSQIHGQFRPISAWVREFRKPYSASVRSSRSNAKGITIFVHVETQGAVRCRGRGQGRPWPAPARRPFVSVCGLCGWRRTRYNRCPDGLSTRLEPAVNAMPARRRAQPPRRQGRRRTAVFPGFSRRAGGSTRRARNP